MGIKKNIPPIDKRYWQPTPTHQFHMNIHQGKNEERRAEEEGDKNMNNNKNNKMRKHPRVGKMYACRKAEEEFWYA